MMPWEVSRRFRPFPRNAPAETPSSDADQPRGLPAAEQLLTGDPEDRLKDLRRLPSHPLHPLAHVEDDLDARQVHSEIVGKAQDPLEPGEILLGIEASIAFGPGRPDQALPL